MYKTVRKGDTSLQYTILPQTDQFTSSGFSQTFDKPKPRIIKYTMGTLMILVVLSCVATPFLISQNDQSLFASTVLVMSHVSHKTTEKRPNTSQVKEIGGNKNKARHSMVTTVSSIDDYREQYNQKRNKKITLSRILKTESHEVQEITATDFSTSTSRLQTSTESSPPIQQTLSPTVDYIFPSILPATFSSKSVKAAAGTPSDETLKMSSSTPTGTVKLSRVTLGPGENETVPQIYTKEGIASYKERNITTSIRAHGLSLQGLILKTPDVTIKPWSRKWFFADSSSNFRWKDWSLMPMKVVLTGLVILASISLVLYYVQRKTVGRQRQGIEELTVEDHEEDKSTLLGGESQEIEEKE